MTFNQTINKGRKNQIIILSILNDSKTPIGFNEMLRNSKLNKKTFVKWIHYFINNGFVEKEGENKRKYQITNKGRKEFGKLCNRDNIDKYFPKGSLVDSIETRDNIQTKQRIYFVKTISSVSAIIPDEKKQELEKGINEKIIPQIIRLYEEQGIKLSGATLISVSPKRNLQSDMPDGKKN